MFENIRRIVVPKNINVEHKRLINAKITDILEEEDIVKIKIKGCDDMRPYKIK